MAYLATIVIPVYNECHNIGRVLKEIKLKVRSNCGVMLIYDFDEDNTLEAAQKTAEEIQLPIVCLKNEYGGGVLNAIKTGFNEAESRYVIVTMADLSDNIPTIDVMIETIIKEDADIVCGSRYMKGGKQLGGPLIKRTLSRLAGKSLFYLTSIPVKDVTNNFKIYSKRILEAIKIESNGGFELGMELVIKAHFSGYKVIEVPTTWTERSIGQSRFKLMIWIPKYLRWYFYAVQEYIFKCFKIM